MELNQDTRRILVIGASLFIGIALIFMSLSYALKDPNTTKDPISGETLNNTYTGGIADGPALLGFNQLYEKNLTKFTRASSILQSFFKRSYPTIKSLSIKPSSIITQGNTHLFELGSDNGKWFNITIIELANADFSLNIKYKDSAILDYNSEKFKYTPSIASLEARFLPLTLDRGSDYPITLKSIDGILTMSVPSCEDKSILESAKNKTISWLKDYGYNHEDLNIKFIGYCNFGHEHIHAHDEDDHDH